MDVLEEYKHIQARMYKVREADEGDDKIVTVALVSDIVDSYQTVLHPKGNISPLQSVPIDFMHNRVSTECEFVVGSERFENVTIPDGKGGEVEVEALVADIRVPNTAKKWTKANRDQDPSTLPSLYDAIKRGQVRWVSVEFEPLEIVQFRDAKGQLVREEYPKYRLNFVSFLETKPGQDTSYVLNMRAKKQKQKTMLEKNTKIRIFDNNAQITEVDEENNKYTIRFQDEETDIEVDSALVDLLNKRAYVNAVIKRKSDGTLGIITSQTTTTDTANNKVETNTVTLLDGSTMEVSGAEISYDWDEENNDNSTWTYANLADVLKYIIKNNNSMVTARTGDKDQGSDETETQRLLKETEELKAKNALLEEEKAKLLDVNTRLANSPVVGALQTDSATDTYGSDSEGADTAKADTDDEVKELKNVRKAFIEKEIDPALGY